MIHKDKAFSGFSVKDLAAAKRFYAEVLGVEVEEIPQGLRLKIGNGILVYPKENHEPATFTILNFPVDDIDEAVQDLKNKGIKFQIDHLKCPSCVNAGSPMPSFQDLGAGNLQKLATFLEASKGGK